MVKKNFLVEGIGEEHFFLEYFRKRLCFFWNNNFHPLLQRFPLPEHDKKVIFTNLIKSLNLVKPLLHRDKLNRFGVEELGDSLTWESVIVDDVVFDDLGVRDDLHVVMVVGVFANHVNELFGGEFFLTYHFEKCCYLRVLHWDLTFGCGFEGGWWGSWLDVVAGGWQLDWVPARHGRKRVFDGLALLVQRKRVTAGRPETGQSLLMRLLLMLWLLNAELGEEGLGKFFFLKRLLFSLLDIRKRCT